MSEKRAQNPFYRFCVSFLKMSFQLPSYSYWVWARMMQTLSIWQRRIKRNNLFKDKSWQSSNDTWKRLLVQQSSQWLIAVILKWHETKALNFPMGWRSTGAVIEMIYLTIQSTPERYHTVVIEKQKKNKTKNVKLDWFLAFYSWQKSILTGTNLTNL